MSEEPYVDAETVAMHYRISVWLVYKLAKRDDDPMPHRKLGTCYRFVLSEVDRWTRGQVIAKPATVRRAPKPSEVKAATYPLFTSLGD